MRIASLFVPLFPLAARLRSEPELREEAVVLVEGNGTSAHVVAATRRARKGGIRAGMTLPQARAIVPRVTARGRDADCERAAQEALLELGEQFSPRIEDGGEGVAYLDLSGLDRIFRSREGEEPRDPEQNLAQALLAASQSYGLPVRIGIASSKLAARVASELPATPTIVPPGEESSFLAPLPIFRLSPKLEVMAALTRWGLGSIGELARLPEAEVAARLGEAGRELLYAARGIDPRPLVPTVPSPSFSEGMDLEWPLVQLEPFLFVANAALDRMAARMEGRGYSCTRLDLVMKLEPDGWDARSIALPAPTRDVKTLLTLARLELEARPPAAPVAGFTFSGHPDKPRRAQLDLFGPPSLAPDKLATAIARIGAMVGPENIGSPRTVDGWLPERFEIVPFDPPPPPAMRRAVRPSRGILAVRVLRPPVPLGVIVDEETRRPRSVKALESREENGRKLDITGEVRIASGPWRLEEGWWTDTPSMREYWDLEVRGGVYRVYRAGDGAWRADGVYD